jgi:hypothetical protein
MNTLKQLFKCIISEPSGCGKTSICVQLHIDLDRLCTVSDFRDMVWCFSEDAVVPRGHLTGAGRRVVYHRGIPDFEEANEEPRLVVLDDLLNEAYSRDVGDLFTITGTSV